LCPHVHLSLQSGCDRTLAAMRRKYDTARFYESVKLLEQYFPGCAITTDLIVGFPGETEEDFSTTLAFVEKCAFSQVHIFPYSSRTGTRAASMPGHLIHAEKQARASRAAEVCDRLKKEYLESFVGKEVEVLFEQSQKGLYSGHCPQYCLVKAEGSRLSGKIRTVRVESTDGDCLLGHIL
ncbi:MAG: radical SAM protein, partial [Clostridia bacterium]|nr:radical SAM protein [Clostridia bacterium]